MKAVVIALVLLLGGCEFFTDEKSAQEYAFEASEKLKNANRLYDAGDYAAAIPVYKEVIWLRHSLSQEAYKKLASACERTGDEVGAIDALRNCVANTEGDEGVYRDQARLCKKHKRYAEALTANRRLLQLIPGDETARKGIEELSILLGQQKGGTK